MTIEQLREYCSSIYTDTYAQTKEKLERKAIKISRTQTLSEKKENEIEVAAQKEAIKITIVEGLKNCTDFEAALIWKIIYETHIHRKSGINDADTITKVVSADQSWKKSSGHAFEEMVKILGTAALQDSNIEILLQRDLSKLIKTQKLNNEPRDISWLKEQIKASIFDLYTIVHTSDGKQFCYGCIQSKTSIRDRVTRDREPSIKAMQSFFWSTIIVLDGDFLRNSKFVSMVNGGTTEYAENGWHGMYVFSEQYQKDRIYSIDLEFKNFKEHAVTAANYWLTQRQWFNSQWRATNV